MAKFYFTYEGDMYSLVTKKEPRKQYFKGGWTEVTVDGDLDAAVVAFGAGVCTGGFHRAQRARRK